MNKDETYSEEAKAFMAKLYPCEPPCDSYGVCANCSDKNSFGAGYNFGYRAILAGRDRLAAENAVLAGALKNMMVRVPDGLSEDEFLKQFVTRYGPASEALSQLSARTKAVMEGQKVLERFAEEIPKTVKVIIDWRGSDISVILSGETLWAFKKYLQALDGEKGEA